MKSLFNKISTEKALTDAWNKLDKFYKSSHGISKETIEDFSENLANNITNIHQELISKKFTFSPLRAFFLDKGNNNLRVIQIPEIRDRVVIKSISIVVEQEFKEIFSKSEGYSFAFQANTSTRKALEKIKEHYDNGYHWILESDLIDFFGRINKDKLLKEKVYPNLRDCTINNLIEQALSCPIGNRDSLPPDKKALIPINPTGIPQGNSLSPLLSNIYLRPFDEFFINQNEKYKLVRYADDFVIMCKSKQDCDNAYKLVIEELKKLDLEIHPLEENSKTSIFKISNNKPLEFLSISFNGKDFRPAKQAIERFMKKMDTFFEEQKSKDLLSFLKRLYNKFDGWASAYYYTNLEEVSNKIDTKINEILYLKLLEYDFIKPKPSPLPNYNHTYKYKSNTSNKALNNIQRKDMGIPLLNTLVELKRNPPKKNKKKHA